MSQHSHSDNMDDTVVNEHVIRGQRLRAAREAMGWGLEEVSMRLRLDEDIIAALEAGDDEHLPPKTFVSGYVRNYARLLGLDENELLAGETVEPENIIVSSIREPEKVSSSRIPYTLVFGIIVIVSIVLMGIWWVSERETAPQATDEAPVEQSPTVDTSQVPVIEETPSLVVTEADTATPVSAEAELVSETETAGEVAEEPVPEPVVEPAVLSENETADEEVLSIPPQPQARLRLSFYDNCWVEVIDASETQLAYDLISEDKTLELVGQAPFRIFLGYSPAVQIYLNDVYFDHSRFQRGDIARFRLGSASDNQLPSEE